MSLRRVLSAAVVTALAATTAATVPGGGVASAGEPDPQVEQAVVLDEATPGPDALAELDRDEVAVVAAANDRTPREMREVLADDTAWLDPTGRLYFVEPPATAAERRAGRSADAAVAGERLAPLSETFLLHSNPDSDLTIFLDFDGATLSGTAWQLPDGNGNVAITQDPYTAPAWDPSGNGASFTDAEKTSIQQIWQLVAEDYAPFDVDVTTEDPGTAGLVRSSAGDTTYGAHALISPSSEALSGICGGSCGGVAYVDVYDVVNSIYQPAWTFPQALGNSAKNVAEATSHEVGHNLGLSHDGVSGGAGYYSGHSNWAPIMGVGYSKPLAQLSQGSYAGANNTQDDVAIVGAYLGTRTDEAGSSPGAAAALPLGTAYVTDEDDVDAYTLGTCTSGASATVSAADLAPNLDVRAAVLDAGGSEIASADPASGTGDGTTASGVSATVAVPAGAGLTLTVDGTGRGTWADGYDDYGSLGAYTVSVTGCDGDPADGTPGAVQNLVGTPDATEPEVVLTWDPPADPGDSAVTSYLVSWAGGSTTVTAPTTTATATGLTLGTEYSFTVTAGNAQGFGSPASVTVTTADAGTPDAVQNLAATYDSVSDRVTLSWDPPADDGGSPVTGYDLYFQNTYQFTTTVTSLALSYGAGSWPDGSFRFGVVPVNATGAGPQTTTTLVIGGDTVPDAPTAVTAVAGDTQADISWTAPADDGGSTITGYTVTATPGGASCSSAGTSCTLTGLTNGTEYTATAVATNAVGDSAASSPSAGFTPTAAATVPGAPTDLTAVVDAATSIVRIAWNAPADDGGSAITEYEVYVDGDFIGLSPGTSNTVGPLAPATHEIAIAAVNGVGTGPQTTTTVVVPEQPPANDDVADAAVLTGATGSVTGDNTGATAEPTDPTAPGTFGAGGYSVWYAWTPTADGTATLMTTSADSARDTTLAAYTGDPGSLTEVAGNDDRGSGDFLSEITFPVTSGTRYLIVVDGFSFTGGTGPFGLEWDLPASATVPDAPTGVTATARNRAADVSWTAPASDGGSPLTSYVVTASPGGTQVSVGASSTSVRVPGLRNGTAYTFTVVATNVAGTSAASAPSTAVTPAGRPGRPGRPQVRLKKRGKVAVVTWRAAAANGARVTRYLVGITRARNTSTGRTRVVLRNLRPGKHVVSVRARNAVGTSAASAKRAFTVPRR